MRITVFGAAGSVGSRVTAEALARGHEVTAVVRSPSRFAELPEGVHPRAGDADDVDAVVELSTGQDVVITATNPPIGQEPALVTATKSLLEGCGRSGVRLLVVGGASTLVLPGTDGTTVMEDPEYPAFLRAIGKACAEQLDVCRADTAANWAYLSPAGLMEPGERRGAYRLGTDELVVDDEGNSVISMEDLAVVLLDEAEQPRHHRTRFTAAY